MPVASAALVLVDRFSVLVDPDSEPSDLDSVLAEFLLSFVRKQSSAETSPTERIETSSEAEEG